MTCELKENNHLQDRMYESNLQARGLLNIAERSSSQTVLKLKLQPNQSEWNVCCNLTHTKDRIESEPYTPQRI